MIMLTQDTTIRQRKDYFLSVLMFKAIHGLAPHFLYNDVTS